MDVKKAKFIIWFKIKKERLIKMNLLVKKLFLSVIFNSCLFLALFVGIQNSANKSKVDFLIDETIELPISFIVGSSFILGSILGSFLVLDKFNE